MDPFTPEQRQMMNDAVRAAVERFATMTDEERRERQREHLRSCREVAEAAVEALMKQVAGEAPLRVGVDLDVDVAALRAQLRAIEGGR